MFRRIAIVLLATACILSSPTLGEESSGPAVRALLLVPGGPVIKLHPMLGASIGKAVQVGARGLSEPFRPGGREFLLAVPDSKEESGYRAVGKVALPLKGKDFVILLEPAKDIFKIHVVDARESRFDADCVLFFNATETILGAALGDNKVMIKPRTAIFAKPPNKGEKSFYQVTFYQPDNTKARPFFNTRWPHREGSRCYVFLYRAQSGRITYQAVDEGLAPLVSAQ
ncbi:MAG: hypothetical protein ACO3SO_02165 [Luteolibacter sp.]